MASRRMFSARVTESTRFIKMPATSQNLYFHLGMNADDDGVVEAYPVMCMIGATEDDLKILVGKQFATVLNEDYVTFLNDWMENNNIRADRKIDSIYQDLLLQIVPDAQLKEAKSSYYSRTKGICQTNDRQMSDFCLQNDSIGKDRLGKDKLEQNRVDNICSESDKSAPNPSGILIQLNDKTFYNVPLEKISLWENTYPAVDVEQELRKMIAWCDSNPTKRKTRRGIERFINNWLSRTQDSGGTREKEKVIEEERTSNTYNTDDEWENIKRAVAETRKGNKQRNDIFT